MNPLVARMLNRVRRGAPDECWPWTGQTNGYGYGLVRVTDGGRRQVAHRAVYEHLVGPVPDGLILDHTCHTRDTACPGGQTCPHRLCCNPSHLEPVTHAENSARSSRTPYAVKAAWTHCARGHAFTPENTGHLKGRRFCRTCRRAYRADRRAKGLVA